MLAILTLGAHSCVHSFAYPEIILMLTYNPHFSLCVFCDFRATVGRSASDSEIHFVDGSLHCEERRRSAAEQHRHNAHPALHQLHRPQQQPCCWFVHILKAFHFFVICYLTFPRIQILKDREKRFFDTNLGYYSVWGLNVLFSIRILEFCRNLNTTQLKSFHRLLFFCPLSCFQSWWVKASCPSSHLKRWRASACPLPLLTTLWSSNWKSCASSPLGPTGLPMRDWPTGRFDTDHAATATLTRPWLPSTRGWDHQK